MTLKDSGLRQEHATGALREPRGQGKGRFDLLPWIAISRLAQHYEAGAKKYADRNWEKGLPFSSFVDSGVRHLTQWLAGDPSEDHLAAVLWNFAGLLWTEDRIREGQLPDELADLPDTKLAWEIRVLHALNEKEAPEPFYDLAHDPDETSEHYCAVCDHDWCICSQDSVERTPRSGAI